MKKLIFLSLLCALPVHADLLDEQDLCTEDKSCCIHSLTTKQKKLWTIAVDKSYCHDGFVQGFTTVSIKDSLNRTAETLHGFFYKGYWLTDFTGKTDVFYRSSPDDGVQDFIFQSGEDKDLHLTYYAVARAVQSDAQHYSAFTLCGETATLIVMHDPISDFKQSLFQSALLKQARAHIQHLCPQTQKLQILGAPINTHNTQQAVFQADIDLSTDEVRLLYHTPIDKNNIPKPTELRHEDGENILTIQPQKLETPVPSQSTKVQTEKANNDTQSATDLALIAKINGQTNGKSVVYVDHMTQDQQAQVTHPTPLLLQVSTALAAGWYLINGTFSHDGENTLVTTSSVKSCQKEWCENEI